MYVCQKNKTIEIYGIKMWDCWTPQRRKINII